MKRRDFLKGVVGAGAVVAVPSLASANKPKRYSMHADGKLTTSNNPNFGLAQLKPEGMKVAYDPSTDPFVKSLGEGIQEGLDILDSIEYKELMPSGLIRAGNITPNNVTAGIAGDSLFVGDLVSFADDGLIINSSILSDKTIGFVSEAAKKGEAVTVTLVGKEPTREQLYFQEAINSVS